MGKIQVPLEILRKPGALTDDKFALVQRHPIDGALILAGQEGIPDVAPVVAFEHHLQPDLRGYPKLSRPRELNLFSLIVSIADVYDALSSERTYKAAMPHRQCVEVIQGMAGTHFDPALVQVWLEVEDRFRQIAIEYGNPASQSPRLVAPPVEVVREDDRGGQDQSLPVEVASARA